MATTPQSRKAKGRKFQQEIRDIILENFKQLEPDDVRSTPMGVSGPDLMTSPKSQKVFPFQPECKCQETTSIFQWMAQAEANATNKLKAVLFFKRNRSKSYAVIEASEFIKLMSELNDLRSTKN